MCICLMNNVLSATTAHSVHTQTRFFLLLRTNDTEVRNVVSMLLFHDWGESRYA